MNDTPSIEPGRLYSFAEAAPLVPSPRRGKATSVRTLERWRDRGQLVAQARHSGGKTWWFVWGADLLRAMGIEQKPEFTARSPAQRARDQKAAEKRLKELGLK